MSDPSTHIVLPSQEPMLVAVGHGIQAFANVEMALGFLYASLMEPADRVLSILTLDAARHIETKLRIVEAIADYALDGDIHAEWRTQCKSVLAQCRKRSNFRHKLAHWTVEYWPGASNAEEVKRMKVALVPPRTSPLHGKVMWGGDQPIHLKQMNEFKDKCNSLFFAMVDLSNVIASNKRDVK